MELIEIIYNAINSFLEFTTIQGYDSSMVYRADPMTIAMATAAALQLGKGVYDMSQSKKRLDAIGERPAYETPESAEKALSVTRGMGEYLSQQGLPSESQRAFERGMGRTATKGVRFLQDTRSPAGVGRVTTSLSDAYTQLASLDAETRLRNVQGYQDRLTNQLNQMATYEEKEIYDKQGNWDVAYAEAMGRREAGNRQIMAGLQTGVNAFGAGTTDPTAGTGSSGAGAGTSGKTAPQGNQGANSGQITMPSGNTMGSYWNQYQSNR